MRVKFTEVNGIPTRYHHEGSGYPLLLIHGVGVSGECWLRNIDALAEDFQVIAPDCIGTGFTGIGDWQGGPPHPYTVKHLIGLADQLGFDQVWPSSLLWVIKTFLLSRHRLIQMKPVD